jgi:sialic acid synthase SpsE
MKIGHLDITGEGRPFFIADIAANHDGSLERAFRLIELAKEAGADVAKFQNFTARKIVSKQGFDSMPRQSHQASWDKSVFEVYEDASISVEWTKALKEKCDEVGIEYMTSPYDFDSIDAVDPYVNAYKIGSGDITWHAIIEYMAEKGKPILLATGASDMAEVTSAVQVLENYTKEIVLMQCNTNYTVDRENYKCINLNVLNTYKERFSNCILGLSDHTPGHTTVLGAIALGARVIEKHFTDDNNRVGPDHKFAMNPKTWRQMVDASMDLYHALGDGIKKVEKNETDSRVVQQRSLYATRDLPAGHVLTKEDLFPLRPIMKDGIAPYEISKVLGRELNTDISADYYLRWEDLKDVEGR